MHSKQQPLPEAVFINISASGMREERVMMKMTIAAGSPAAGTVGVGFLLPLPGARRVVGIPGWVLVRAGMWGGLSEGRDDICL